jgi:hypothetical protein
MGDVESMTLVELKQQITDKQCDGTFMIFVCPKLPIIAEQYIDAIAEVRQLDKLFVDSIFDTQTSAFSLVMDFDTNLKVCRTETFSEIAEDYMQFNDTIVLCEAVDKKLQKLVADYVVTFPTKLETWQAAAYMQSICPGLSTPACEWLYEACKGDLYKVINELDKIKVFPQNEQALMLELLKLEPGTDLFYIGPFDFSNALVSNNKDFFKRFYPRRDVCKVDIYQVTNSALGSARDILYSLHTTNGTLKEVSPSKLSHIQRSFSSMPKARVQELITELSSIDLKIKSGLLDMPLDMQLDYLVTRLVR